MHRSLRNAAVLSLAVSLPWAALARASFKSFAPTGDGFAYPSQADGRITSSPSIQAYRVEGGEPIKVDGRLDDGAWQEAEAGRGFRVWEPDRGIPPTEETVFKVAYDQDAIYFGVACHERDPSKVSSHLSRRDRFSNSDIVSVYIDPYNDKTTGYNFRVNPLGVVQDSYIFNDGDRDDDWDAVWEAQTYRDAEGWYAEIRIPFSAIRYRSAESMTWGLDIWRYMHGRGEDTAWVTWNREERGFVSRFGHVTGIAGVRPPRQLEMLPYVVSKATDPSVDGSEDAVEKFGNLGVDLKYGVSADLTLNATIQPDFGQVEADPAVLNLSPFETFFQEKRPFFVEGSRFFQHPDFNLFYSRRIGTGDPNSRIRYAAKLTGKTAGGVSVAGLVAASDVTSRGQAHNLLKDGEQLSRYFVGRFGRESASGRRRFNLTQTVSVKTADVDRYGADASREAYTTGFDFDLNSADRAYNVHGSAVGSVISPEASPTDPSVSAAKRYGSGGNLDLRKVGGGLRAGINGRWMTGKLDLNDLGYVDRNDRFSGSVSISRPIHPEGKSNLLNRGELNFTAFRSWLWAGRTSAGRALGTEAWSYGKGHPEFFHTELNGSFQFRNYREAWWGVMYNPWGTQRYETRGGPLLREPETFGFWLGGDTDTRKNLVVELEGNLFWDVAGNYDTNLEGGLQWNQSSALSHNISLHFLNRFDDTQYLETVDLSTRPGGVGIGGQSYVFGRIHQRTLNATLRTNVLFSRDKSLEIYAQPYLTVGDYAEARELIRPDSYVLVHYAEPGYEARDKDFSYGSVNLNAVFRWEYRPGSTLFLVWTQGRSDYERRGFHSDDPARFDNDLRAGTLFHNEPENVLLAKVTYWFAI